MKMSELIKINDKGLVSAKELYLGLGLNKSNWSRWYPKNIQENEYFIENADWAGVRHNEEGNETMDFAISIEFAKHIAMMARTSKSHEYRNYFIECEKKAKANVPKLPSYSEALRQLADKIDENAKLKEENQKKTIENKALKEDNSYKGEVIQGFTDEIPVQKKRAILNKVVRKGGNYQERWNLLYKTYKEMYHIDIKLRYDNYNKKNEKKFKSVLDFADKKLGAINELYGIACKLYESDIEKLIQEMYGVIK